MAKKPRNPETSPKGPTLRSTSPDYLPTVAIGFSAGGLKPLQELFEQLPADLGLAYIVIGHLNPDGPSELATILQRSAAMPVESVQGAIKLQRDHVYVIPPTAEIVLEGNTIGTRDFDAPRGRRSPIDRFFRSMGEHHGDGFAIVLSGGGSDGSVGLKAVKEGGGVILVQEPAEAEVGSMPRSAIATGLADVVLPIRDLAVRLRELAHDKQELLRKGAAGAENSVSAILGYLRSRTGHDFSRYKRSTVMRRLARRMQLVRTPELLDYLAFLRDNVEEVAALFSDLLISVTTFFRDAEAFDALSRHVVPSLLEVESEPVRVWVPGCATGEEAYTIAMILLESAAKRGVRPDIQIFATDLDTGVLATAREGRYPAAIENDVGEERIARYFTRDGDHFRIKKEVRDLIVFANHSLLKDPPFSRLDLVSCRNLLIYLERDLQTQVCSSFHYALKPGRFLFLGSAETADATPGQFRAIDREQRIYQSVERLGAPSLPRLLLAPQSPVMPAVRAPSRTTAQVEGSAHLKALEEFAPPSVVVDDEQRVVHLSESAGRFFQPSGGPLGITVTQLARPELRLDLRTGLHRAFEKGEASLSMPVPVQFNGHAHRVLVSITPLTRSGQTRPLALVMFIDGGLFDPAEQLEGLGSGNDAAFRQLQQELQVTRERLKASREEYEVTNEELRAANEELQSINEEYRSTAEELETSKEELQSMNEELQTLNTELKLKLEGVSRAHSDLQNLMAATEVGTLFLDIRLRIKRFTPRVAELFNITPSDEGRPITDFTHRLNYDQLELDARKVLKDLAPLEREAESREGLWYLMRLRPYRTVDDKIDGVVVSFVDVTERRRNETRLRNLTAELDHRVKNILARVAVVVDRSQDSAQSAEEMAATLSRRIQSMAETHSLLSRAQWSGANLKQLAAAELSPYRQGDNVVIAGEDFLLNPAAAQAYSMALHELTTNAVKYGSLSKAGGRIKVDVAAVQRSDGRRVILVWRETGGPSIAPPEKRGFGLSVIEEQVRYEFGADTLVDFQPAGLVATIDAPAESVSALD